MNTFSRGVRAIASVVISLCVCANAANLPRIQQNHGACQLMVDDKPFLMLGGEFSNNVFEAPKEIPFLDGMLEAYRGYHFNTVLVPISWRSLEPKEGEFDYRMIDTLIDKCQKHGLKTVVLWFGTIKNGGLHYAPRWVIEDRSRFFRARDSKGKEVYAIFPLCEAAWQSDIKAFTKLMQRIKDKDAQNTVIMIQPENETGCQEIDEERDHSPAADRAWDAAVPDDLMKYLIAHDGNLEKWLQTVWNRNGKKSTGKWPEVFGADIAGQKIFMSYYIGSFIERVASAGKAIHPLPMYINDWLGGLDEPGGPIGGPDFQVMDIFRVTTPTAFAFAPDIYQDNFKAWLDAYDQLSNPIMVPEAHADARAAQQCWLTYFQHNGLLFSPYLLVPHESDQQAVPVNLTYSNLRMSYGILKEMQGIILQKQGLRPRELLCFELDKNDDPTAEFHADFQGFAISAKASRGFGNLWEGKEQETPGFAAIVKMEDNDFVVIGKTMCVKFQRNGFKMESLVKGQFRDNQWVGESPLEITSDMNGRIDLTDAPRSITQIRVRFGK